MPGSPAPAGRDTERLQQWAVDPTEGGRIFRWDQPGATGRAVAFFTGKIPTTRLGKWVDDLHALAAGR